MKIYWFFVLVMTLFLSTGCSTVYKTRVDNTPGRLTHYEDINTPGSIQGVGIEAQDISSMTDKMVRDMLQSSSIAGRVVAPYIIVDDKYFINESSQVINKRMITERLMVNLNRAADNRMIFVERSAAGMVEQERILKRTGIVHEGTTGMTAKTAGADFRLSGRIMSLDSVSSQNGSVARYNQIVFKMIELETGLAVWTGIYEFKKAAQDNIMYR